MPSCFIKVCNVCADELLMSAGQLPSANKYYVAVAACSSWHSQLLTIARGKYRGLTENVFLGLIIVCSSTRGVYGVELGIDPNPMPVSFVHYKIYCFSNCTLKCAFTLLLKKCILIKFKISWKILSALIVMLFSLGNSRCVGEITFFFFSHSTLLISLPHCLLRALNRVRPCQNCC